MGKFRTLNSSSTDAYNLDMATDEENLQAELQSIFMEGAPGILEQFEEQILALEGNQNPKETLASIFRAAHSMKGSAASVGFTGLAAFAHKTEDCLAILRNRPELLDRDVVSLLLKSLDVMREWVSGIRDSGPGFSSPASTNQLIAELETTAARLAGSVSAREVPPRDDLSASPHNPSPQVKSKSASTIKVDAERVDLVMDLVGELVVIKSQLLQDAAIRSLASQSGEGVLSLLDKTVRELYDKALSLRMMSLKSLFLKIERAVRDTSVKLDKEVAITLHGEDTELDRAIIEQLGDPLMHLVRNAVDHGIEAAEERFDRGKSAIGALQVSAGNRGSNVVIEIIDDGRGLDAEKIAKKAVEKGLVTEQLTAGMRQADIYGLLFMPGFSTADKITDISGRGVGLDVVKTAVTDLKGQIEVESNPGHGTTFRLVLPLTTAIMDGVIISAGGHRYILPIELISEFVSINPAMIEHVDRGEVLTLREEFLPVIRLAAFLGFSSGPETLAIVVESSGHRVALLVDSVIQQSQVVLKGLSAADRKTQGVSGAAILGDGKVALVLDPASMRQRSNDRHIN